MVQKHCSIILHSLTHRFRLLILCEMTNSKKPRKNGFCYHDQFVLVYRWLTSRLLPAVPHVKPNKLALCWNLWVWYLTLKRRRRRWGAGDEMGGSSLQVWASFPPLSLFLSWGMRIDGVGFIFSLSFSGLFLSFFFYHTSICLKQLHCTCTHL